MHFIFFYLQLATVFVSVSCCSSNLRHLFCNQTAAFILHLLFRPTTKYVSWIPPKITVEWVVLMLLIQEVPG